MRFFLIVMGAACLPSTLIGQTAEQPSPAATERPELKCVVDRAAKDAPRDVSARLLAAEIADRCGELIPIEGEPCTAAAGSVEYYTCKRVAQIYEDTREQRIALLEKYAERFILLHRQR
jgi:hypothetical protein